MNYPHASIYLFSNPRLAILKLINSGCVYIKQKFNRNIKNTTTSMIWNKKIMFRWVVWPQITGFASPKDTRILVQSISVVFQHEESLIETTMTDSRSLHDLSKLKISMNNNEVPPTKDSSFRRNRIFCNNSRHDHLIWEFYLCLLFQDKL